jgi:hypothetical protein
MILEARVLRARGDHVSSNYFYFQDDGEATPAKAVAMATGIKAIITAAYRQFSSLNTFMTGIAFRGWPESLSSPIGDWWIDDFLVPQIGIVPTFNVVNPELCARIDTRSILGSRRHFLAYIPEDFTTTTGLALTLPGRVAFASIAGLQVSNWIHVSWSRQIWAPVDVVDVLDAITSHGHRRPTYRMFSTETSPF